MTTADDLVKGIEFLLLDELDTALVTGLSAESANEIRMLRLLGWPAGWLAEGVDSGLIREAIHTARDRGLISRDEASLMLLELQNSR